MKMKINNSSEVAGEWGTVKPANAVKKPKTAPKRKKPPVKHK